MSEFKAEIHVMDRQAGKTTSIAKEILKLSDNEKILVCFQTRTAMNAVEEFIAKRAQPKSHVVFCSYEKLGAVICRHRFMEKFDQVLFDDLYMLTDELFKETMYNLKKVNLGKLYKIYTGGINLECAEFARNILALDKTHFFNRILDQFDCQFLQYMNDPFISNLDTKIIFGRDYSMIPPEFARKLDIEYPVWTYYTACCKQ